MGAVMTKYFSTLFTSEEGCARPVLECLDGRINDEQNEILLRPILTEEVKGALFSMHPDKSPGPDGLSPAFYGRMLECYVKYSRTGGIFAWVEGC